jgi:hypothetical protein
MMASIADRKAQMQALWRDTSWEDVTAYIGPNADTFRATWEKQRAMILDKGHGIAWGFSEDESRHYSMDANNELHVQ